MCDMCKQSEVTDEVRAELDGLSAAALQQIVNMVQDEVAAKNDIMIASILRHFDVTSVTLKRENVQDVNRELVSGAVRLDGDPSADDKTFTFSLKEGSPEDGLQALMKALGLA